MERLDSYAELLARAGDDPWVRWGAAARPVDDPAVSGAEPLELWVHRDIALIQRTGERRGFWVVPLRQAAAAHAAPGDEADRVREALTVLRDGDHLARVAARTITIDAAHGGTAYSLLRLGEGGDWDWMWTVDDPPATAAEERLIRLDDGTDADEINAFAAAHNHRVWALAGTGQVVRWLGIRARDGELLAIGGSEREESGAPHLAGIVTHTGQRGKGFGAAVSTGLVRWALADSGVCTLGMYSDNAAARSVYRRIGFGTARAWQSRRLLPPASDGS